MAVSGTMDPADKKLYLKESYKDMEEFSENMADEVENALRCAEDALRSLPENSTNHCKNIKRKMNAEIKRKERNKLLEVERKKKRMEAR